MYEIKRKEKCPDLLIVKFIIERKTNTFRNKVLV